MLGLEGGRDESRSADAMADVVTDSVITPVKTFAKDSIRLINKCTKPDRKGMFV